jgi:C_GCAxxG_C_C family probable redox protein
MLKLQASQIAREEMKSGYNCCQAVLLAASQVWEIPLEEDTLAAASQFAGGMGSGCACGALVGMMMAAGIMNKYHPHPAGQQLPQQLHDQFKREHGSTCCRIIRKKHSLIENIANKACIDLTSQTTRILVSTWEGVFDTDGTSAIHNNTDSE